jgi:putative spermidine/putrescine transport system permease protein
VDRALEQGNQRLSTAPSAAATGRPATRRSQAGRSGATPASWSVPAALFLLAFFLLPLAQFSLTSLYPQGWSGGLQLDDYRKLLADPFYLGVLGETLALSLGVSALCVLVGYPAAYFLVRQAGRWQGLVTFLLIAPLLTSIIMRTFGWRVLLARFGIVNVALRQLGLISAPIDFLRGPAVAVTALVHVLVPFMVLSIAASLHGIDRRLEESARLLGAGRLATFFRITLPLTMDGIGTGFVLVFMLTNGSFVTLLLLGGGLQTLPLLIFQQFNITHDFPFASAMGNVLLLAAALCMFLQIRLIRRRGVRAA